MASHDPYEEMAKLLSFESHDPTIRVEHGLPMMLEIDRIAEEKDVVKRKEMLLKALGLESSD